MHKIKTKNPDSNLWPRELFWVLLTVILDSFPAQRRPESKRAVLMVCPPGTEPMDTIHRGECMLLFCRNKLFKKKALGI